MDKEKRVTCNVKTKNSILFSLRITHYSLLFLLICLFISPSLAAYVPDQVIVKFKTTPARSVSLKSIDVKSAFELLNVRTIKQVFPDKPAAARTITSSGQVKQLRPKPNIFIGPWWKFGCLIRRKRAKKAPSSWICRAELYSKSIYNPEWPRLWQPMGVK